MKVDLEGFVLAGEEVAVTGSAVAVTPISFPTCLQHYPRCLKLRDDEDSLAECDGRRTDVPDDVCDSSG